MKKLLTALMFLGFASVSQAAFIPCAPEEATVFTNGASIGPVVFTCSPGGNNVNGDGLFINSIELLVSGVAGHNAGTPGNPYGIDFSSTNTLGLGIGNVGCTASSLANAQGQATASCNSIGGPAPIPSGVVAILGLPDSLGVFTVSVTGLANPEAFSGSASVAYQVGTQSPVPEPTSLVLMGSGLLGLGMIARRRKK